MFFGKRAVSPVIGTILMVAVTVIMAAIIGGFVYQTGRPKVSPNLAATLEDDDRVALTNNSNDGRVARLTFEGGKNIAKNELKAVIIFTGGDGTEHTASLEGKYWATNGAPFYEGEYGNFLFQRIYFKWVDSDESDDLTPGDRLDFYEDNIGVISEVAPNTDVTIIIIHQSTQATLVNQTIRVY